MLQGMLKGAVALMLVAGVAQGAVVATTLTADNHYAIYSSDGVSLTFQGGNELGRLGDPGNYNWSEPESLVFEAQATIYIAAWSDDAFAQGLLGDITINGVDFSTGNAAWQVYRSTLDRDDDAAYPTTAEVSTQIAAATLGNFWETPHVGGLNGIQPWGVIPGISTNNARWMWADVTGDTDPLDGGVDAGEYLIFRLVVPTPATAALLGVGGLVALRRRR